MKKTVIEIEELVHVNAPLSVVELHYEQEAAETLPWSKEKFKIKPYIFYRKEGDQVYFYYDPVGISWQMEQSGKFNHEELAIKTLRTGSDKFKDILIKEKALSREDFADLLKKVRALWPWFNYLWWAIEYREKNGEEVEKLMAIRKYTEYFTPGLMAVFRNTVKNLYPKLSKYSDVILLKEVENNLIPDISILEKRLAGYAYTAGKLYDSWSDLSAEFKVKIKEHKDLTEGILSGQTAFAGKAVGKVRIISKREDISKFEIGEVLVASTTTPDYLPAMQKSAAIISEHGGIICHAAITSRELKIPCIVGVRGATKYLEDGDVVEVDAKSGIIKLVK